MSVQSFRYDSTAGELTCFLFKKKTCPKCGEQMRKDECCEVIDSSVYNTNSVPLCVQGHQVRHYFYRFTCQGCRAESALTELSKQEGSLK